MTDQDEKANQNEKANHLLESLVEFNVHYLKYNDIANMTDDEQLVLAITYLQTEAGSRFREKVIDLMYDDLQELIDKERRLYIEAKRQELCGRNRFERKEI